jgi:hypothetical protein
MGTMGTNSWQTLNSLAANGQLELDPSVREDCAKACDDLINELGQAMSKLHGTNFRFNLGDFTCPAPLIDALEATAMGDDGFYGRLQQHIEIVQEIKATILHQVQQLQGQDDANAGAVQVAGAQPNIVAPPTPQQADQAATQAAVAAATSPGAIQAVLNNVGRQINVPPPVL